MNFKLKRYFVCIIHVLLGIALLVGNDAMAQHGGRDGNRPGTGDRYHHGGCFEQGEHGFWNLLTEEQQAEVKAKIQELKDLDATREEIRTAIDELLNSWGIERPEHDGDNGRKGKWHQGRRHGAYAVLYCLKDVLTEDQLAEVKSKIIELREQEATQEEIKNAIAELLAEYGVEMPEDCGKRKGRHNGRFHNLGELLTEEQYAQLVALKEELREQGASREEIHEAVVALLESFGIEMPKPLVDREIRELLTKEQKKELWQLIRNMKKEEATVEEINAAIAALLAEWGIELPEDGGDESNSKESQKMIEAMNNPNPFNPETTITYTLANDSHITIRIFNMSGQLIKTLVNEYKTAGSHSIVWDGRNEMGNKVVSGIYYYQINSGTEIFTQRMTLLK